MGDTGSEGVPNVAVEAVMVKSEEMPEGSEIVKGYDFNDGIDYHKLLQSYKYSGFQATNFGLAVDEINKMIKKRGESIPEDKIEHCRDGDPVIRNNCTIFLGYTSNMASCGVRETIRFLAQHNMIDAIVATAGGIEEDFIKCLAPTYIGNFELPGKQLRDKGINRIGNLLVPNNNYVKFEDWLMPKLDILLEEQERDKVVWTPSKIIHRLGLEIDNPESIYYWTSKNNIPVFSPALTDGSLGDMLFFHSFKKPGLIVDILGDLRHLNKLAMRSVNTGMIILGGGLIKHHICNANLMRNGADFSLFVNTSSEFDGSDSGARPDEAISWGKIRKDATPVKIYGETSLIFPLLVSETFARHHHGIDK